MAPGREGQGEGSSFFVPNARALARVQGVPTRGLRGSCRVGALSGRRYCVISLTQQAELVQFVTVTQGWS